jgi:ABC-type branched-subunit amino acid transport system substrate-binding protein
MGGAAASAAPFNGVAPVPRGAGPRHPGGSATAVDVGRGVTATEIRVGVYVARNGDAAFKSFGVAASPGDNEKQARAVLDQINAEGGLRGRKFTPVFQSFDLTSSDREAADQAACETWKKDKPVFAVVSMMQESDVLFQCLAKAGIPYVSNNATLDGTDLRSFPGLLFQPSDMTTERLVKGYIGSLFAQGFLTPTSKVGWLVVDNARGNRSLKNIIAPEMARRGLNLAAVGKLSTGANGPNQSGFVLQFRNANVDRVLTLQASPLFFMQQAESQQYHPLYGIHSGYAPGFLQTAAPAAQLKGAKAFAWLPVADTDASNDPGAPTSRAALCQQLMQRSGQDTTVRTALLTGLWYCDALLFIRDALAEAPNLTQRDLALGARALKGSYVSGATFSTSFVNGRQDGVAAYRDLAYQEACSCFRYSGPVRSLPD